MEQRRASDQTIDDLKKTMEDYIKTDTKWKQGYDDAMLGTKGNGNPRVGFFEKIRNLEKWKRNRTKIDSAILILLAGNIVKEFFV